MINFRFLFLLLFFCSGSLHAQLVTILPAVPEECKAGTMYVVMKDTGAAVVEPYKEVARKYWKYCKVGFVNYSDVGKTLASGNSYLGPLYVADDIGGLQKHIILAFQTPKDRSLKKDMHDRNYHDVPMWFHKYVVLSTDKAVSLKHNLLGEADFDYKDIVANWSPGLFKNYLLFIQDNMTSDYYRSAAWKAIVDPGQIKNLKNDTLFISQHSFQYVDFMKYGRDLWLYADSEKALAEYPFPYKIISEEELSNRILSEGKPFYYLSAFGSAWSGGKRVNVVNSASGSLIYSDRSGKKSLTADDLNHLVKAINME